MTDAALIEARSSQETLLRDGIALAEAKERQDASTALCEALNRYRQTYAAPPLFTDALKHAKGSADAEDVMIARINDRIALQAEVQIRINHEITTEIRATQAKIDAVWKTIANLHSYSDEEINEEAAADLIATAASRGQQIAKAARSIQELHHEINTLTSAHSNPPAIR